MELTIATLAGMTEEEIALAINTGVNSGSDLSTLCFADITAILPAASIVKRRKLEHISKYIARGQAVTRTTTMEEVVEFVNTPVERPRTPSTGRTGTTTTGAVDPTRGAPRLSVNALTQFCGAPVKFEEWNIMTTATLGQTNYVKLIESPPVLGDVIAETRNTELYHMLVTALMKGSGFHVISKVKDNNGHEAWTKIQDWYGSAATGRSIINHYRTQLESLKFDEKTTASEYVNAFSIASQKLEQKNEGDTPESKLVRFLDNITDDDYDVVKQQLTGDVNTTFDTAVTRIRSREQELEDPMNPLKRKQEDSLEQARAIRVLNKEVQRSITYPASQDLFSGM